MAESTPCVYCRRRPANPRWRPFCSERCKMADLGRWLNGDYRVPGTSPEPAAEVPDRDHDDDDTGRI